MIEKRPGDICRLQWKNDFRHSALIIGYHFPEHDRSESSHDHDFIEVQLCVGGRGRQQTATGDHPFTRGSAMLIRPGAWHRHHDNENLDAWICCFDASLLMHELLWTLDDPELNQLLWRRPSAKEETNEANGIFLFGFDEPLLARCIPHFDALVALGENDEPAEKPLRLGYLTLILACLAQAWARRKTNDARTSSPSSPSAPPAPPAHIAVKRGLMMMEADIAAPWTAGELARQLNIDISYFGRLFKATLGVSPMSWLARTRVARAAQLLNRTDKPVSEIAIEVGWPDPVHFARRFRAHYGMSASAWRELRRRHQTDVDEHPDIRFRWATRE
jgi:AraC family L-rhamnose operon transcriptional activator RhaR